MAVTSRNRSTAENNLASIIDDEVNALRLEAIAVLEQWNDDQTSVERLSIKEAALGSYGSPIYALRKLITHLPKHNALAIIAAHEDTIEAGLPEESLLTDEHIMISQSLNTLWFDLRVSGQDAASADFKKIMSHALNHIEDGHFIVSLYVDRGMRTHREILDFLTHLKATSHQVFAKGVL